MINEGFRELEPSFFHIQQKTAFLNNVIKLEGFFQNYLIFAS
jgi:hypothetical protein